jgi:hypothetical protein
MAESIEVENKVTSYFLIPMIVSSEIKNNNIEFVGGLDFLFRPPPPRI